MRAPTSLFNPLLGAHMLHNIRRGVFLLCRQKMDESLVPEDLT